MYMQITHNIHKLCTLSYLKSRLARNLAQWPNGEGYAIVRIDHLVVGHHLQLHRPTGSAAQSMLNAGHIF